jgi:RsiW-degrading membrane proteinase PrsW (M82 family)
MSPLQRLILIPLLSLLPCVLWLWYFYSKSVYKRPPLRLIVGTFLLGGVSTLLALALNLLGQSLFLSIAGHGQPSHILVLFFVVGPIEELVKLLVVYVYAYRQPEFDEPLDGVIYSTAAALGFAAMENVVYLSQNSPLLVLLRGPLSNPGHALFSSVWGLSLSRAKAAPNIARQRLWIIARGWLAASVLHALFDMLLLAASESVLLVFPLLLTAMIALFLWVRARIRFHSETSPHREGTLQLQAVAYCQECGERGTGGEPCAKCGSILPQPGELRLCPVCSSPQRPGATFCERCGGNLALPAMENLHSRPHFVTLSDGEEQIAYIINRQEIFIGRTLNNAFVIANPSVSKRHARVVAENGGYALYDLGSSNGTFINGKRVTEAKLQDGCEVRFGRAAFVFRARRRERVETTDAHR